MFLVFVVVFLILVFCRVFFSKRKKDRRPILSGGPAGAHHAEPGGLSKWMAKLSGARNSVMVDQICRKGHPISTATHRIHAFIPAISYLASHFEEISGLFFLVNMSRFFSPFDFLCLKF
jgi:hypothetical protein